MSTTSLAAVIAAAIAAGLALGSAAVAGCRRLHADRGAEQAAEVATATHTPRPSYVTPDPDWFAGVLGMLVMTAESLAVVSQTDDDALPMVGRIVGNPQRGSQIWILWADGRTTYGEVDEFMVMRPATAEQAATSLVFLADVALLPRYEVWGEAYDHSTDASLGYRLAGFADALPDDDDEYAYEETYYVDRWNVATIQGRGCDDCECVRAAWAEVPF